jgi:hypothetical protein
LFLAVEDNMNDNKNGVFVPDFSRYSENRRNFPSREQYLELAGQVVAFSPDGTRILAHGKDEAEVRAVMAAAGLNPSHAVWSYFDPADVDSIL